MAYEKYIKKDGKLYGPYIYHSRRVDGKVISEYHGQKKLDFRKFLWLVPLAALIILGAYFIGQQGNKATGYSILGINADYQEGQPLEGNLVLLLNQGELIPAESKVVFENGETRDEYLLAEIVSEQATEGNFFVAGKNLSGYGSGFGLAGMKEIYPEVSFVLLVEEPDPSDSNTAKITEAEAMVSAGADFTYSLEEGQGAEIKLKSAKVNGMVLPDNTLNLIIEENLVTVSTTYAEEEEGFGVDFTGEKTKELVINLNDLNLLLQKGGLRIGVVYDGEELVSLETAIGDAMVSGESEIVVEEQPQEQIIPASNDIVSETNITEAKINVTIHESELTPEERAVLIEEFGNISLAVKEAKEKNGFIVVRYELGDFWIEYSYNSGLEKNTLASLMEADRTKWLKDLAQGFLQPEENEQQLENFTGNYSY